MLSFAFAVPAVVAFAVLVRGVIVRFGDVATQVAVHHSAEAGSAFWNVNPLRQHTHTHTHKEARGAAYLAGKSTLSPHSHTRTQAMRIWWQQGCVQRCVSGRGMTYLQGPLERLWLGCPFQCLHARLVRDLQAAANRGGNTIQHTDLIKRVQGWHCCVRAAVGLLSPGFLHPFLSCGQLARAGVMRRSHE